MKNTLNCSLRGYIWHLLTICAKPLSTFSCWATIWSHILLLFLIVSSSRYSIYYPPFVQVEWIFGMEIHRNLLQQNFNHMGSFATSKYICFVKINITILHSHYFNFCRTNCFQLQANYVCSFNIVTMFLFVCPI